MGSSKIGGCAPPDRCRYWRTPSHPRRTFPSGSQAACHPESSRDTRSIVEVGALPGLNRLGRDRRGRGFPPDPRFFLHRLTAGVTRCVRGRGSARGWALEPANPGRELECEGLARPHDCRSSPRGGSADMAVMPRGLPSRAPLAARRRATVGLLTVGLPTVDLLAVGLLGVGLLRSPARRPPLLSRTLRFRPASRLRRRRSPAASCALAVRALRSDGTASVVEAASAAARLRTGHLVLRLLALAGDPHDPRIEITRARALYAPARLANLVWRVSSLESGLTVARRDAGIGAAGSDLQGSDLQGSDLQGSDMLVVASTPRQRPPSSEAQPEDRPWSSRSPRIVTARSRR